jgi:hypothetical protein
MTKAIGMSLLKWEIGSGSVCINARLWPSRIKLQRNLLHDSMVQMKYWNVLGLLPTVYACRPRLESMMCSMSRT